MSQVSLGDEVEKAKESTNTAPIEYQPCTVRVSKQTTQSGPDIGHPDQ